MSSMSNCIRVINRPDIYQAIKTEIFMIINQGHVQLVHFKINLSILIIKGIKIIIIRMS